MIKFFRNIRQQLLTKNSISKYLLYALGEIILVVIGILIALQINNWNEDRKLLKEEKETIASLKLEFQKNLSSLQGHIAAVESIINAGNTLLEHTGPDYEFGTLKGVDSLISLTPRMSVWDPSLYTLSSIKNSGKLSGLSNEDLKLLLIEWESFYGNLLDWADFYVDRGITYFDYLTKNALNRDLGAFGSLNFRKSKFDRSNETLLRNQEFENVLVDRISNNMFMLRYYREASEMLREIIAVCETYEN